MDFKGLKALAALPDDELTAKLVGLYGFIADCHGEGKGIEPFDWSDLAVTDTGALYLEDVAVAALTDEVRERNLWDYAAVVYCVSTRQKSAEAMTWDAGRKISQPVLREIVLTLCGRNHSVDPLLAKLRKPYVSEDDFFRGYSTVDEKEATEAYEKNRKIRNENEVEEMNREFWERVSRAHYPTYKGTPWYEKLGYLLLIAICVSGYKVCTRSVNTGTPPHVVGTHTGAPISPSYNRPVKLKPSKLHRGNKKDTGGEKGIKGADK